MTLDDPSTLESVPNPGRNVQKDKKIKKTIKKKKKKSASRSETETSSSSEADSVPLLMLNEPPKEEFYDAHDESFHSTSVDLGKKLMVPKPVVPGTLMMAHSENWQNPKEQQATLATASSHGQNIITAGKEPFIINKPATDPH